MPMALFKVLLITRVNGKIIQETVASFTNYHEARDFTFERNEYLRNKKINDMRYSLTKVC
jgi:hypothetical protein